MILYAGGMVKDATFQALPSISPLICTLLVLFAQAPVLIAMTRSPRLELFPRAVVDGCLSRCAMNHELTSSRVQDSVMWAVFFSSVLSCCLHRRVCWPAWHAAPGQSCSHVVSLMDASAGVPAEIRT